MRLKIGAFYKTADGRVHGPIHLIKDSHWDSFKKYSDEIGNWYSYNGNYWEQSQDCPFRLVEEINGV